jgi:hypothetical protein
MGLTPATGSEIAMSCVYDAFGFPLPTLNISLNGVLGLLRQPPQALGVSSIPAGSQTTLSSDMGGLTTIDDYTCGTSCTLSLFYKDIDLEGWSGSTAACESSPYDQALVYFSGSCPSSWNEAYTNNKIVYGDPSFTTLWNTAGGNNWYKSVSGTNTGDVFQITSGVILAITTCSPASPSPTPTPNPTPTPTPTTLYYTLNGCTGGQPLYDTTITPTLTNQRYFDPVTSGYWTWDNAAGTSSPQQTVNNTIIIQAGQSGCP